MSQFRVGDIVARRKGLVMHKGLMVGADKVLHNTPLRGEHVSSLQDFARGRRVRREAQVQTTVAHAHPQAPRRSYHLLRNNCEHTVYRAVGETARSPQLRAWGLGAALALVGLAATRHPAAVAAGFALGKRLLRPSAQ